MVALQQLKTGLVADSFFLMVNDDPLGRPRLSERIFALGLALGFRRFRRRDGLPLIGRFAVVAG
jgi:hypothetical protein